MSESKLHKLPAEESALMFWKSSLEKRGKLPKEEIGVIPEVLRDTRMYTYAELKNGVQMDRSTLAIIWLEPHKVRVLLPDGDYVDKDINLSADESILEYDRDNSTVRIHILPKSPAVLLPDTLYIDFLHTLQYIENEQHVTKRLLAAF